MKRRIFLVLTIVAVWHTTLAARPLTIVGRVTLSGRKVGSGTRDIYVQISRDYPTIGSQGLLQAKVDASGRFRLEPPTGGNYWLLAYIDTDKDGHLDMGREVVGFAFPNPVPIGDGRDSFRTTIDLDPLLVTLVTRFEPASNAGAGAKSLLESLEVVPLDPQNGALLRDAQVHLVEPNIALTLEGGAFRYRAAAGTKTLARYVLEVMHPAYGKLRVKRTVAPRAFGAVPRAKLEAGKLEWTTPSWANFSSVQVVLLDGTFLFEQAAQSPFQMAEIPPGSSVRVRIGRIDVQHAGDVAISTGDTVLKVPF